VPAFFSTSSLLLFTFALDKTLCLGFSASFLWPFAHPLVAPTCTTLLLSPRSSAPIVRLTLQFRFVISILPQARSRLLFSPYFPFSRSLHVWQRPPYSPLLPHRKWDTPPSPGDHSASGTSPLFFPIHPPASWRPSICRHPASPFDLKL